jgi:hypothetical protein
VLAKVDALRRLDTEKNISKWSDAHITFVLSYILFLCVAQFELDDAKILSHIFLFLLFVVLELHIRGEKTNK